MTSEAAPAKVNLALHVTGQRADGYHLLDSLVVFARSEAAADRIGLRPSDRLTLVTEGPQSGDLTSGPDNLVLQAARLMRAERVEITLHKVLPVASGIGGGSADAAATVRALARMMHRKMPPVTEQLTLGADVPVCCHGQACRMRGIGEALIPEAVPDLPAVLVNPGIEVPTPKVFAALRSRDNPPLPQTPLLTGPADAADWLRAQRNDLEPLACLLAPEIAEVLVELRRAEGCLMSRMSGSGATCFGLFADMGQAEAAARHLRRQKPHWWVVATLLG